MTMTDFAQLEPARAVGVEQAGDAVLNVWLIGAKNRVVLVDFETIDFYGGEGQRIAARTNFQRACLRGWKCRTRDFGDGVGDPGGRNGGRGRQVLHVDGDGSANVLGVYATCFRQIRRKCLPAQRIQSS